MHASVLSTIPTVAVCFAAAASRDLDACERSRRERYSPARRTALGSPSVPLEFLLVIGRRIAPGIAELDGAGRRSVEAIIEKTVAARPRRLQRQLALFLNVIRWAPLARYGRRFDRLPPRQQDAVLRWFQNAPLRALRSGFWGVRTLVFLGYYGRPEIGESIAYRPSHRGNDFLHAR
jgi:hypothetical protein